MEPARIPSLAHLAARIYRRAVPPESRYIDDIPPDVQAVISDDSPFGMRHAKNAKDDYRTICYYRADTIYYDENGMILRKGRRVRERRAKSLQYENLLEIVRDAYVTTIYMNVGGSAAIGGIVKRKLQQGVIFYCRFCKRKLIRRRLRRSKTSHMCRFDMEHVTSDVI